MSDKSAERFGPWTRLSSTEVYDNRWIAVRHETVITPAGTDGVYGVVHFKSRAVGIIPIDADGYIQITNRGRGAINPVQRPGFVPDNRSSTA